MPKMQPIPEQRMHTNQSAVVRSLGRGGAGGGIIPAAVTGAPSVGQTVASSGYSFPQYVHFFIRKLDDGRLHKVLGE